MPTLDRRVIRLASIPLAAMLIVGACGSSSTPAPTTPGGGTQAPGATTAATQPAATEPGATSGTGAGDSIALPSGLNFNQAPDLEAVLPSQLCGGPVEKHSYAGAAGAGADASANPMIAAFGALGASGDVSIAVEESTTTDTCPVNVFAYRVKGLNSQMFTTVLAAMAAGGSKVSLGGKDVTKIAESGTSTFIYVKDDTLFGVSEATDDQAGQALSQLP